MRRSIKQTKMGREGIMFDPNNLDTEWQVFQDQYIDAAEKVTMAESERDRIKDLLDQRKAKIRLDVIAFPEKHGLKKTTVDVIDAVITVHEKVVKLWSKLRKAETQVSEAKNVLNGYNNKRKVLESYVQLHTIGYFSQLRKPTER
jgi:phosphopantothenate synthetase